MTSIFIFFFLLEYKNLTEDQKKNSWKLYPECHIEEEQKQDWRDPKKTLYVSILTYWRIATTTLNSNSLFEDLYFVCWIWLQKLFELSTQLAMVQTWRKNRNKTWEIPRRHFMCQISQSGLRLMWNWRPLKRLGVIWDSQQKISNPMSPYWRIATTTLNSNSLFEELYFFWGGGVIREKNKSV